MRPRQFVETVNVRRLRAEVKRAAERAAPEVSWVLVHGEAGTGKTATLVWLAHRVSGAYIRAKAGWTPAWMLADLAADLGVASPTYSTRALFGAVSSMLREAPRPIVVDELDLVARHLHTIETLRDLSDTTDCIIVGGGGPNLVPALRRYPQIWSRVAAEVPYGALKTEDVEAVAGECTDMTLSDGVAERLAELAGGKPRRVLGWLAVAERCAQKAGTSRIGVEHLPETGAAPGKARLEAVS